MKPILVITYWSFKDALIQSYTLPYIKIITRVSKRKAYLVCLEQPHIATTLDERVNINNELKLYNIEAVFFNYNRFSFKQMLLWALNLSKLVALIINKRVEYLHTWCTPGGAIGYLLSIITQRALILDSYEPHAELMVETGTWQKSGLAYKILFELEKRQTIRASKVIGVVDKMLEYSLEKFQYQINPSNFYVKPACINFAQFYPRTKNETLLNELGFTGKIVGVYAGKIGGIYLETEIFAFIKQCYIYWGENFRMLMLTNISDKMLVQYLNLLSIPQQVVIKQFVDHNKIADYMSLGDFAINFMKPVPARRFSTPIKDGEYWAMGLPVIITEGISDDSDIIRNNNIGYVLKALTTEEYLHAIKKIEDLLAQNDKLNSKIEQIGKTYRNFAIAENIYQSIYN